MSDILEKLHEEIGRLRADTQDTCAHHAEELRTVWDRNAELLTEIERLRAEVERLKDTLRSAAMVLNRARTDIEHTLWPNSGFAKVAPSEKEKPEDGA